MRNEDWVVHLGVHFTGRAHFSPLRRKGRRVSQWESDPFDKNSGPFLRNSPDNYRDSSAPDNYRGAVKSRSTPLAVAMTNACPPTACAKAIAVAQA